MAHCVIRVSSLTQGFWERGLFSNLRCGGVLKREKVSLENVNLQLVLPRHFLLLFPHPASPSGRHRSGGCYFKHPGEGPGLSEIRTTKIGPKYEIHTEARCFIVCVGRSTGIAYFSEPSCNLGLLDSLNKDI